MKVKLIPCQDEQKTVDIKTFVDARKIVASQGYESPLEIINLSNGKMLLIDEEGKLKNLPMNSIATDLAHESESIYPSDFVCGDVILVENVEEFDLLPYE